MNAQFLKKLLFILLTFISFHGYSQNYTVNQIVNSTTQAITNNSIINICPGELLEFEVGVVETANDQFTAGVHQLEFISSIDLNTTTSIVSFNNISGDYKTGSGNTPQKDDTDPSNLIVSFEIGSDPQENSDYMTLENVFLEDFTPGETVTITTKFDNDTKHTFTINVAEYSFSNTPSYTNYCTGEDPQVAFSFSSPSSCKVAINDFSLQKTSLTTGRSYSITPTTITTNGDLNDFVYSSYIADKKEDLSLSSSIFSPNLQYYVRDFDYNDDDENEVNPALAVLCTVNKTTSIYTTY